MNWYLRFTLKKFKFSPYNWTRVKIYGKNLKKNQYKEFFVVIEQIRHNHWANPKQSNFKIDKFKGEKILKIGKIFWKYVKNN